jgi:hypothetical protein
MADIIDKDGNVRRTDAKVKGDIFDFMMLQTTRVYEPRQFSDYPETTVEVLRQFVKLWGFPEAGIPSKKQKGLFERWVSELQNLTSLCGSDAKLIKAMELAFKNFENHHHLIKSPISIYSDLLTAVAELNREEKKNPAVKKEVVQEEQPVASKESVESTMKNLKRALRKEDD